MAKSQGPAQGRDGLSNFILWLLPPRSEHHIRGVVEAEVGTIVDLVGTLRFN